MKIVDTEEQQIPPTNIVSDKVILVVDDDRSVTEILKLFLSKNGYTVLCAYDGKEALEYYQQKKPDLIILDIMMPIMSGFEVCSEIRKTASSFDMPILVLTSLADQSRIEKIMQYGANDYLTKPYSEKELLSRVRVLLTAHTNRINEFKLRFEAEKELEKTQQLLAMLLDAEDKPIITFDCNWNVNYMNEMAENLYPSIKLDGPTIRDFLTEESIADLVMLDSEDDNKKSKEQLVNCKVTNNIGYRDATIRLYTIDGKRYYILLIDTANKITLLEEVKRPITNKLIIENQLNVNSVEDESYNDNINYRKTLVKAMCASLALWQVSTNKSKNELAEASNVWRVYADKSSYYTRTLDKYLKLETLPKNPRKKQVIKTVQFVLSECKAIEPYTLELHNILIFLQTNYVSKPASESESIKAPISNPVTNPTISHKIGKPFGGYLVSNSISMNKK